MFASGAVLLAAACTGACTGARSGGDAPTPEPTALPTPVARVLAGPTDVVIVGGATPVALSIEVSRALFVSSPLVVVTRAAESTAVASAATHAERLGVPLLLLDDGAAQEASQEATRLGATTALAIGGTTGWEAAGIDVIVDPAAVQRPAQEHAADVAVLVPAEPNADIKAGVVAAAATAKAAGASVFAIRGEDPRTDPQAIDALAKHRDAGVLAVGFSADERLAGRIIVARTGVQLPGGGQTMFPGRRLVALYGHPGTPVLGVLGEQDLDASISRAREMAAQYEALSDVPVVPTFEIIATVAQQHAGADGDYSGETDIETLRPWVEKAGAEGVYVVLDLQPGRADPLEQAKLYTELLKLPHVGLAIDPEWALKPNQLPLKQIGSLDASKLNEVGAWLDELTAANQLPQKLYVLHQFRLSMIANEAELRTDYDNVAVLIHMDGQGTTPQKIETWSVVITAAPVGIPFGWKNFYDEDHPMLTPELTMRLVPTPLMISYQ